MTATVLAIDPGTTQSAWLILRGGGVVAFGILDNDDLADDLRHPGNRATDPMPDVVVIERIASYGMPVGEEVFETVRWTGRFEEAADWARVGWLTRLEVKMAICHDSRAKDPSIRQACIDRFGATSIKKGGQLHGVSKDVWSALAVGLAWHDMHGRGEP